MGPDNGGFVISSRDALRMAGLLQFRAALWLEIRATARGHKMMASRAVNAKTIIPRLLEMGIVKDVDTSRLTQKRKIDAYIQLDLYLTAHGFDSKALDLRRLGE